MGLKRVIGGIGKVGKEVLGTTASVAGKSFTLGVRQAVSDLQDEFLPKDPRIDLMIDAIDRLEDHVENNEETIQRLKRKIRRLERDKDKKKRRRN